MIPLFIRTAFLVFLLAILATIPAKAQEQAPYARFSPDIVRLAPPGVLADTVNVWGAVSQRGRFMVPRGTSVSEILSYTGGPDIATGRRSRGGANVLGYFTTPQVDVYLNRKDENENGEYVERWTYRLSEPFPPDMRNYPLRNGEYVTVYIRERPTTLQYILFGVSTLGSLAGGYFLLERIL